MTLIYKRNKSRFAAVVRRVARARARGDTFGPDLLTAGQSFQYRAPPVTLIGRRDLAHSLPTLARAKYIPFASSGRFLSPDSTKHQNIASLARESRVAGDFRLRDCGVVRSAPVRVVLNLRQRVKR